MMFVFLFLICKRENNLTGFAGINKEWVHCDESKKYLLLFGYCQFTTDSTKLQISITYNV